MATRAHSKFTPIFEGQTVRATVVGMAANVIIVRFKKARKSATYRASFAAKQARVV